MEDQLGVSLEIGVYSIIPELVIPFMCDPHDRDAVSLVCRRWYEIDRMTRKHVKIWNSYAATPGQLSRRFPQLESLKIKGMPWAGMFKLIPADWGGSVTPWVEEVTRAFPRLISINFKGMTVSDSDLGLLATTRGGVLEVLKLDNCSGFSTDGLLHITRSCRSIRTLFLEWSIIAERDGKWLHELAVNNRVLENLSFYWTDLVSINFEDLELIAKNCSSLVSLKISYCDILDLIGFFRAATALEEFCGGSVNIQQIELDGGVVEELGRYSAVSFPQRLCHLGLTDVVTIEVPIVFPIAAQLRKLDLLYSFLDTGDHCLLLQRCPNLEVLQLKISVCDILDLIGFFRAATALEEFCAEGLAPFQLELDGVDDKPLGRYSAVSFPQRLWHLGLTYLENVEVPIVFPIAAQLRKLDLLFSFLDTEGHCLLLQRCPNLEVLLTTNEIGDGGLQILALFCKRLKRLRIAPGNDDEAIVSQRGLIALAQGCLELEYLVVYISDITNEALEYIGKYSKYLYDFRINLLDRQEKITDLPLDNGVRSLLFGCSKLRRLGLYLRPGGLTDIGLGYIGQYGAKISWMLLGRVGESDDGLLAFSWGCHCLRKLVIKGCYFSERAIAMAVLQLTSLRFIWVQEYMASVDGRDLLAMVRPFWNIELTPRRRVAANDRNGQNVPVEHPAHVIAYFSLAGQRTDLPDTVVPLNPADFPEM